MSDANNSQADGNKVIFPDFAELWKELYFKTEGAWADAFKEFVSTDTFVKMLDQTLTQHLSMEKMSRQNIDKLFELSGAPSKKDLARIAELVISVEEKVDNLDYQLLDNVNRMADSLIMMSGLLEKNQRQLAAINMQNTQLYSRIQEVQTQNIGLQDIILAMQTQNAELNKHFTDVITNDTELHSQTDSIQAQNSEMKTQLMDIKKQNTQLKTQITDIKKQIAAFNQKLTVLNGKNDDFSKKDRSSKDKRMPDEPTDYKQAP